MSKCTIVLIDQQIVINSATQTFFFSCISACVTFSLLFPSLVGDISRAFRVYVTSNGGRYSRDQANLFHA